MHHYTAINLVIKFFEVFFIFLVWVYSSHCFFLQVQSQESSRTLATLGLTAIPGLAGLTGLATLPGLAGLTGLAAIPGLAALNNPNVMNQLNKPTLDLNTLMNSLFWPGSTGLATTLGKSI
jgi:hypothetical protein